MFLSKCVKSFLNDNDSRLHDYRRKDYDGMDDRRNEVKKKRSKVGTDFKVTEN